MSYFDWVGMVKRLVWDIITGFVTRTNFLPVTVIWKFHYLAALEILVHLTVYHLRFVLCPYLFLFRFRWKYVLLLRPHRHLDQLQKFNFIFLVWWRSFCRLRNRKQRKKTTNNKQSSIYGEEYFPSHDCSSLFIATRGLLCCCSVGNFFTWSLDFKRGLAMNVREPL